MWKATTWCHWGTSRGWQIFPGTVPSTGNATAENVLRELQVAVIGWEGMAEGIWRSPRFSLVVLQVAAVNKEQWPFAIQLTDRLWQCSPGSFLQHYLQFVLLCWLTLALQFFKAMTLLSGEIFPPWLWSWWGFSTLKISAYQEKAPSCITPPDWQAGQKA